MSRPGTFRAKGARPLQGERCQAPEKPGTLGKVYLVGAGPGDPALITRRGADLLRKADCLIYDRLAGPDLLKLTRPGCERIYVGKSRRATSKERTLGDAGETVSRPGEASRTQKQINRLLVQKARRNRIVVRLKGGDPTLFGRVSEELEALVRAKIPFEIVPGVSSVWAAAAAAGIPLTDRRYSSSVAVVTGQEAAGKTPQVRWELLARAVDTLVILMGRASLPAIARRLRRAGKPAATPVALIRSVSTPEQDLLVTPLGKLEQALQERPSFGPPVVAIIGEVVRLRKRWLRSAGNDKLILKGKRILITRSKQDAAGLTRRLEELGATCVSLPTIGIRPRTLSAAEARRLLIDLPRQDWILFTSHHGVEALERVARRFRVNLARTLKGKICAIGPRTAESVRKAGLSTDRVPAEFSTEGIRRAFREVPVRGRRILIPRSNLGARDPLARELRRKGAKVEEAVLYETVPLKTAPARVRQAVRHLDAATFTSASTVNGFLRALKEAKIPLRRALNGAAVAAIGPATAQALRAAGVRKLYLPKEGWTVGGLVEAVKEAMETR